MTTPGDSQRPIAASSSVCAACPVLQGECPTCGTFWIMQGGKRHGIMPSQRGGDGTTTPYTREYLPNFIDRPMTDVDMAAARQRVVAIMLEAVRR